MRLQLALLPDSLLAPLFRMPEMAPESACNTLGLLGTNGHIIRVLICCQVSLIIGCSQVFLKRKEKRTETCHTGISGLSLEISGGSVFL